MPTLNNKTYITAHTSANQDTDIVVRILESIRVMRDKGYVVERAGCSSKLFLKIAKKVARMTGLFDEEIILLKFDEGKPIPLVNDVKLLYNKHKQFYLRVINVRNQKGTCYPTFNKPVKMEN